MRDFSTLVHQLYRAALLPDAWPDTLLQLAGVFEAECALIMFANRNAPVDMITSPGVEHIAKVYFEEEWWRQDIRVHRGPQVLSERGVDAYTDHMVATADEIENHPIYADFIPRTGLGWCMIATILPEFDMPVLLAVHRDKAKGPFIDQAELDTLVELSRHIEQALRISLRLSRLEASETALLTAWDAVQMGMYALDSQGRPVLTNRFGTAHFDNFFHLVDGRLHLRNKRLRVAPGRARASVLQSIAELPKPQIATGMDGSRIALWSIPIMAGERSRIGLGEEATMLMIAVPLEAGGPVAPAIIRDLFGLSLGEARLASLIGAGIALHEAAVTLGIAEGTARVVLKRVFRKLGVNRQAELVREISRLGTVSVAAT